MKNKMIPGSAGPSTATGNYIHFECHRAFAQGDMHCDGHLSTFSLTVSIRIRYIEYVELQVAHKNFFFCLEWPSCWIIYPRKSFSVIVGEIEMVFPSGNPVPACR